MLFVQNNTTQLTTHISTQSARNSFIKGSNEVTSNEATFQYLLCIVIHDDKKSSYWGIMSLGNHCHRTKGFQHFTIEFNTDNFVKIVQIQGDLWWKINLKTHMKMEQWIPIQLFKTYHLLSSQHCYRTQCEEKLMELRFQSGYLHKNT